MTSRPKMGYPSDLTDSQWTRLEPILPPARPAGRHRTVSQRDVANAINYRWETGCVWRMLPHDFPPWGTVYAYFRAWQKAGVIRQLREILLEARPRTQPRMSLPPQRTLWPTTPLPADREPCGRNTSDPRIEVPDEFGLNSPGFRSPSAAMTTDENL